MSMQTQEQSQRTKPVPGTNGAHPVEDGIARPAGFPTPESASVIAEAAPTPAAQRPSAAGDPVRRTAGRR